MRSPAWIAVSIAFACVVAARGDEPKFVLFDDPLGQVQVGMPPMGDQWKQAEREIAPKLISELRFTSEAGPAAVLVSTRIRAELPKDDRVLERVEPKYQNFKAEHGPGDVVVEYRGKPPHRTLEFAVAGGEYQEAFPYVVGGHIGVDDPPKSVTISQFFVDSDRMFEVAIYLPNAEKVSKADLFGQARKVCDQWRSTIAVKP